jgi:WXG100 family type VII secretion target
MSDIDSTELHVSPDLENAPRKVRASAEQLREQLEGLRRDLQPMLDHWDGETKKTFEPYQDEWHQAATHLFSPDRDQGVLGSIAQALQDIWNHYVETEHGNASTWKH